ncbi:MAG: hypothetical protein LBU87_04845 [Lactobacillales bacterium]|jgi:succinyl-CoA synthetase alpha subunit|nr:hypothetical protein [Lactobacillales bacterium]
MIDLPHENTPILCQGITTSSGAIHTELSIAYGSRIVAGTSRDKGITSFLDVPVFKTVREALRKTNPKVSVIYSTPMRALQDVEEAVRAKIPLIICTTERVPTHDILKMKAMAEKNKVTLIGPSSLGLVRTGECLIGDIPAHLFPKGNVGIIGRSSSLTYEAVKQLALKNFGVSVCVSLGASEIITTSFIPVLDALFADKETEAVLAIGQLHGSLEYELAHFYHTARRKKPVIIYIPGASLPPSQKDRILGTTFSIPERIVSEKYDALSKRGIHVARTLEEIGDIVKKVLPKNA